MFEAKIASGSFTGNGSTQSISCGFQPKLLLIYNSTDGDTLHIKLEGQANGVGLAIGTATAAVASNGATLSARGFSVGSDTSVNESSKAMYYLALG